ncbi:unnamed protein product [Clonostachys rosea]|uniref:Uncharacterized protein n=1 Tax=Bionectria ochroleuca TaxID=29856 RepID=A0ABY6V2E8_BIOOC|nr:unnamed protein product [Clonostachys rosea]
MDTKGTDAQKQKKIRDLQALHDKAVQELDALLRKCIKQVEEGHGSPEAQKGRFDQVVMDARAATGQVTRPSGAGAEGEPMPRVKDEEPVQATMGHIIPYLEPRLEFQPFKLVPKGGRGPVAAPVAAQFNLGVRQTPTKDTCPAGPSKIPPKRHRARGEGDTPRKFPKLE